VAAEIKLMFHLIGTSIYCAEVISREVVDIVIGIVIGLAIVVISASQLGVKLLQVNSLANTSPLEGMLDLFSETWEQLYA
jgi:hypothetical protein